MAPLRPRLMIDSARRMLRHGAHRKVAHLLEGMQPGDSAAFFESITVDQRRLLAQLIGRDALVRLLGALSVEVAAETFEAMEDPDIVALIGRLPREDAAAVLRFLGAVRSERLIDAAGLFH